MKTADLLLILICVAAIAAGQILFKMTALSLARAPSGTPLLVKYFNPWFLAALVIYMVATVLWVWVLRTVPLTLAYPFMALAFFLVPLLSAAFFGEPFGLRQLMGNSLIFAGILVVVR